jgi:hypothetical protein
MIRIIACRVGRVPETEEMEGGLAAMQEFVGGRIECVALSPEVDLWCNEEFLAAHNDDGDTVALTEEQCDEWLYRMRRSPVALRF